MSLPHLVVVPADPQGDDATALLALAAREAQALYPELHDPRAPGPTNGPTPPRGLYLVAYLDGAAVAMAAHRPVDDTTTEVRRMYVCASARRSGIGRQLLRHLEHHARAAGFERMILETGNRQRPAMRLYTSCGFVRIPAFGAHADDPTSVCYGKLIARGAGGKADPGTDSA